MPIYEGQLIQSGGLISGSTDLYANLPDPSLHESEVWYVAEGSGGALAFTKTFYKYPKGLYSPNGLVWEQIPLNVHLAEDSTTLINITNWAEWVSFAIDISVGDRLIFNGKDYVNKTGTQTSTSPNLDETNWGSYIVFNPSVIPPSYQKGLTFYDNGKNALSYFNEEADITVNMGQEILIPVYNDTGSTIENGSIVYPTGAIGNKHTVGLADASVKAKCRLVAMATHDIENNSSGYVTRLGSVGGIDTTGLSGVVYLSTTTPGAYTMTKPNDGAFIIAIGAIKEVGVNGSITVDPNITELTVEVTDTNGFPNSEREKLTISIDSLTRTFTISSSSYPFHYYMTGEKYEKDSSESIVFPDTEGLKAIIYDAETLTVIDNPNDGQIDLAIRTKATVAYLYWDADNSEYNYFGSELHGIFMAGDTHAYLHFTRGSQYLSGLGLNGIISDASGDLNTSAQFGTDSGFYADEDLITTPDANLSTAGLPIYYLDGATGNLRRFVNSGFSVVNDITIGSGVTGRLVWNEFTGSVWQLSTVTNNDFVLCHVFAVNGPDGEDQMVAFMGQADYTTRGAARAGAEIEISNLLITLPVQEIIPVATLIFQTSNGYDNDVQARIISTEDGEDYVDWRTSELSGGSASSSHNNLANLEIAGPGITWGHVSSASPIALPSFTTAERDALANPQEGWHIYNSTTKTSQTYNGTSWV